HVATFLEWAPIRLKGKARPIVAYQVQGVAALPGGRRPSPVATPFVGRAAELAWLHDLLASAIGERTSRIALVAGVAGVGKTRLAEAFVAGAPDAVHLAGACVPFGERTPWHALASALRDHARIAPSDGAEQTRRKLGSLVGAAVPASGTAERAALVRDVATVLGLEPDPAPPSATELNLDLAQAVRRTISGLAAERPVVVTLEDVHWADPQLLAFLRWVAEEPWPAPVLMLCLGWSESLGQVPVDPRDARSLSSLGADDARRLLGSLLPGDIPPTLAAELLDRSGGNPLFLEELVRLLSENRRLKRDGDSWHVEGGLSEAVPETVQLVVAARLDGLSGEERRLCRDAAIAGDRFWDALLRALGWGDGLDALLDRLAVRDLIREQEPSGVPGTREFAFKHFVIRDVAYASVPRADRAGRHLAIADWLRSSARPGDEPVDLLAFHYGQAVLLGRESVRAHLPVALDYLRRAASRAERRSAHREAVAVCEQALDAVSWVHLDPASPEAALLAEILLVHAQALVFLSRHQEARAAAAQVEEVARASGRRDLEAHALVARGRVEADLPNVEAALPLFESAAALYRTLGDRHGQAIVLSETSYAHRLDDLVRQRDLLERATLAFAEIGDFWWELRCCQSMAWLQSPRGGEDFLRWYRTLESLTARAGDRRSVAGLRRAWGYFRLYAGDLEDARTAMADALAIGREIGDLDHELESRFPLGLIALALGDVEEAARHAAPLSRVGRRRGWARTEAEGMVLEARVASRRGRRDEADAGLARAEATLASIRQERELSEVTVARTEVALDGGAWTEAAGLAERFVEENRRFDDRLVLPHALGLVALARLGAGDLEGAEESARSAAGEAQRAGNVLVPARAACVSAVARALRGEPPGDLPAELPTPVERALAAEARALSGEPGGWEDAAAAWSALGETAWRDRSRELAGRSE
ncbi:MAG TPA: AAA family ATPase, partial [Actinomycetota bacterium]|nr:AAA family ATPase [Actinomycetota bacterium]